MRNLNVRRCGEGRQRKYGKKVRAQAAATKAAKMGSRATAQQAEVAMRCTRRDRVKVGKG